MHKPVIALIAVSLALVALGAPRADPSWTRASGLSDGLRIHFVAISPAMTQDEPTYQAAITALCSSSTTCQIEFYAAGQKIPAETTSAAFVAKGGFGAYPRGLASFVKNANSGVGALMWNCDLYPHSPYRCQAGTGR